MNTHTFTLRPEEHMDLLKIFMDSGVDKKQPFSQHNKLAVWSKWVLWKMFGQSYGYAVDQHIQDSSTLQRLRSTLLQHLDFRHEEDEVKMDVKCLLVNVNDFCALDVPTETKDREVHMYLILHKDAGVTGGNVVQHTPLTACVHHLEELQGCVIAPSSFYQMQMLEGQGLVYIIQIILYLF